MVEALKLYPEAESTQVSEPPEILTDHMVLFHGSGRPGIEELREAEENTVGKGVYLTTHDSAKAYARRRAEHGKSLPVLYTTELNGLRLVSLDNPIKLQEIMQKLAARIREIDFDTASWFAQEHRRRSLSAINDGIKPGQIQLAVKPFQPTFTELLKSEGYDGLKTTEGGEGSKVNPETHVDEHETYVIFDPKKVKVIAQEQLR